MNENNQELSLVDIWKRIWGASISCNHHNSYRCHPWNRVVVRLFKIKYYSE